MKTPWVVSVPVKGIRIMVPYWPDFSKLLSTHNYSGRQSSWWISVLLPLCFHRDYMDDCNNTLSWSRLSAWHSTSFVGMMDGNHLTAASEWELVPPICVTPDSAPSRMCVLPARATAQIERFARRRNLLHKEVNWRQPWPSSSALATPAAQCCPCSSIMPEPLENYAEDKVI